MNALARMGSQALARSGGALATRGGGGTLARIAGGGMSTMMRNTLVGAGAGAGWGAISDDTSVLGGALMGAGLGAGGTAGHRMGRAGMNAAFRTPGLIPRGAAGAAARRGAFMGGAMGEAKLMGNNALNSISSAKAGVGAFFRSGGVTRAANRGYGRVASTMKGWTS